MPSASSSSAGAIYLDREQRIEALRLAAARAAERMPAIRRIVLFGSIANGVPTPRSDADLLIEVSRSDHGESRDRIPEVLRALAPLPCPVDLFVLTSEEIERFSRDGSPLLKAVFRDPLRLV